MRKSYLLIGLLASVISAQILVNKAVMQSKPDIKGPSGRLEGVEVLDRDGNRICVDPWYHEKQRIVSCE